MISIFDSFTNQYSVSKTLRFELKPEGKTKELIRQIKEERDFDSPLAPLILEDEQKAEAYKKAKKIIDDYHRDFIKEALNGFQFQDEKLELIQTIIEEISQKKNELSALKKLNDDTEKETKKSELKQIEDALNEKQNQLAESQDDLRNSVFKTFAALTEKDKDQGKAFFDVKSNSLTPTQNLIKEGVPTWLKELSKDRQDSLQETLRDIDSKHNANLSDIIKGFKRWTSYFGGFNKNRANIYTSEAKATGIAFRIVHENLPKFLSNQRRYHQGGKLDVCFEEKLSPLLEIKEVQDANTNIRTIGEVFSLPFFNKCLTQSGIDRYNLIIGGQKKGDNDIKGVNQIINEASQRCAKEIKQCAQEIKQYKKEKDSNKIKDLESKKKGLESKQKSIRSCFMQPLFKQILSENKESFSSRFKELKSDKELIEALSSFGKSKALQINKTNNPDIDLKKKITKCLQSLIKAELSQVYIKNDGRSLAQISKLLFENDGRIIEYALERHAESKFPPNKQGKISKKTIEEREKWIKNTLYFSIEELNEILREYCSNEESIGSFEEDKLPQYFNNLAAEISVFKEGKEIRENKELLALIDENFKSIPNIIQQYEEEGEQKLKNKKGQDKEVEKIKAYLDSLLTLFNFLKPLQVSFRNKTEQKQACSFEKDMGFYKEFDEIMEYLGEVLPLYNQARNYLTKKEFSTEKFKLNFENSTLADGWDVNREKANTAVLLRKEGRYYLAVMKKDKNTTFEYSSDQQHKVQLDKLNKDISNKKEEFNKCRVDTQKYKKEHKTLLGLQSELDNLCLLKAEGEQYKKMEYQQISDASKDIQNLILIEGEFVRKTRKLDELKLKYIPEIHRIKKAESYMTTANSFCKEDLNSFIDYYKKAAISYWQKFDLSFKNTPNYNSFKDFTNDIQTQGYRINFTNVSEAYINKMVEDKALYLFQIYNKDFSTNKQNRGTDNLHTMYWKALFEEENLKNVVFKLNGQAELFYRKASIKSPFVHKEGTILKHKRHKDAWEEIELPIGKDVHTKDDIEKKEEVELIENNGSTLVKYKNKTIGRVVRNKNEEITKNKRFSEDKILFHLSITLNYNPDKSDDDLNKKIQDLLLENDKKQDVKIIGIDRGERHLAYYTLINQKGEIEEQGSLNTIKDDKKQTDYHQLLDGREKERQAARKSWDTIDNIKNLKEGYLSQVVHKIAKLAVENNAIIVFEDLNTFFKRSRIKFEKQVYQKLEKALVTKLSYYVDKEINSAEPRGVLKGLQLAEPVDNFKDLTKQTGIIFYVPAAYTSKVCPKTGFVNLIPTQYKNVNQAKDFFGKFEKIVFNAECNYFEFHIDDYTSFNSKASQCKQNWIICTYGERLEDTKDDRTRQWVTKKEPIDLTKELKSIFNEYKIDCPDDVCLKESILGQDKDFFEKLMRLFRLTLQMRNSRINADEDWLISPVKDGTGVFFDSRNDAKIPNADANGAYHIALKGLYLLEENKLKDCFISNNEWFEYIQHRENGAS